MYTSFSGILAGHSILLAEDHANTSGIENFLSQAGASILLATDIYQILHAAGQHQITAVVIDVALGNDVVKTVAEQLQDRGVPVFVVQSSKLSMSQDERFDPVFSMPVDGKRLLKDLAAL